jgi:fructose-1,6-bisphosphatase/inositol monophosphatase family enzyme
MDEMYTAIKGQGAYMNGKRIYTNKQSDIQKTVINYEVSLARAEKYRDLYLYRFSHLIGVVQGYQKPICVSFVLIEFFQDAFDGVCRSWVVLRG